MAQIAKVEAKTEIKCSPAKFYDFVKYNIKQFANMMPNVVKSVELIEGEEGKEGNVKLIEYVLGKTMTIKLKTETINDEERSITFVGLAGDFMQAYISIRAKMTVLDESVECVVEVEKANDLAPNPDMYATLAIKLFKGLDLYLLSQI